MLRNLRSKAFWSSLFEGLASISLFPPPIRRTTYVLNDKEITFDSLVEEREAMASAIEQFAADWEALERDVRTLAPDWPADTWGASRATSLREEAANLRKGKK